MASIDLNQLFQQYLTEFQDPVKASQYTAFQYIANPRGSVTGLKKPPTWYTKEEWYKYSAPDYVAVARYNGDDELTKFTRDNLATATSLADLSRIARDAAKPKKELDGKSILTNSGLSVNDYYTQLRDIYYQKNAAEKAYDKQKGTHVFSQYGLDPEARYGLVSDPTKNIVAYKPAVDYVKAKIDERYKSLISRGVSAQNAKAYTEAYAKNLGNAVMAKINAAGINPFVDQVYAKVKIRK